MADSVQATLEAHRRALAAADLAYQRQLAVRYAQTLEATVAAQARLNRLISDARRRGQPVKPTWLNQQERYLELQSKYAQALREFGADAAALLSPAAQEAVRVATAHTQAEADALAGRGPGLVVPGFDSATWSVVNRAAVEHALAMFEREASPLRAILERDLSAAGVAAFQSVWAQGVALGWNPNRIASVASRAVANLTLGRAQLIARTEFHRAYRSAKQQQFDRSPVIDAWIWRCAVDRRSCAVCFAMHGTEHPTSETMVSHPNCRCAAIPKTKDWRELGLPIPTDTRAVVQSGEDLFRKLPVSEQRRLLGPTRLRQYQEGASLSSFLGTSTHPIWGTTPILRPLRAGGPAPVAGGANGRETTLRDFESRIAAEERARNPNPGHGQTYGPERGILVDDKTGKTLWSGTGEAAHIARGDQPIGPGTTVTHFHPDSGDKARLSSGDVDEALKTGGTVRAFNPNGSWAEFTPNAPGSGLGIGQQDLYSLASKLAKEQGLDFTDAWHEVLADILRKRGTFRTGGQ